MKLVRIVSEPSGDSRFEDQEVAFVDGPPRIGLSEIRPALGTVFRRFEAGFESEFHPTGMRELAVVLTGRAEYEVSSGDRRVVGPGDVVLLDDTSGVGHRSRNLDGERVMLVVGLP